MKAEPAVLSLLESVRDASLGTLEAAAPYVSAVSVLYEKNPASRGETGRFFLFLSDLARHTRNLRSNSEVSLLLLDRREGQLLQEVPRVTVQGTAARVEHTHETERLKILYAQRFPDAEKFLSLADFRFYEIILRELHWIAGFGAVRTLR